MNVDGTQLRYNILKSVESMRNIIKMILTKWGEDGKIPCPFGII
jgi:hypothetical protein